MSRGREGKDGRRKHVLKSIFSITSAAAVGCALSLSPKNRPALASDGKGEKSLVKVDEAIR